MKTSPRHLHTAQPPLSKCPSPADTDSLIPQRAPVLVAHSPPPLTPFLCLNSISTAGNGCAHEHWCLRVSIHGTSLSPTRSWPPTPATLGAAPATFLDPIVPSWHHPAAASFPHDTFGGYWWPSPHCHWALQHPCLRKIRREANRVPSDAELRSPSRNCHLGCTRGPQWDCYLPCSPVLSTPSDHPSCRGNSGWHGRLGPRPSLSSSTTTCTAGPQRGPHQHWATATWRFQGGGSGPLPVTATSG